VICHAISSSNETHLRGIARMKRFARNDPRVNIGHKITGKAQD
jgi:hypothetical protein